MTNEHDVAAKHPTDLLGEAKAAAGKVAHTATEQIQHRLDSEKNKAVEAIGGVADALRQTGERRTTPGPAAALAGRAADGIEDVADYLQSRSLGDVIHEVERFARREPAIFLGAAFTLGLVGGRFLKSSAASKRERALREEAAALERSRANPAYGGLPQAWSNPESRSEQRPSSAGNGGAVAGSRSGGSSIPGAPPGAGSSPRTTSSASPGAELSRTSSLGARKESSSEGSIGMDASNIGSTRVESSAPQVTSAAIATPTGGAMSVPTTQAPPGATSTSSASSTSAQPDAAKSASSSATSHAASATSSAAAAINDPNEKSGDRKDPSSPRGKP